ncbi:Colistin resistance protein EmrA [Alphaproteobacteria bacterium SO-S41]|nr:Colistin resistance protein EmrA [Alphaproteobacteria bacterium SO-S41]
MRRYALLTVAVIVACVAVYYGFTYFTHGQYIESTDDAYIKADTSAIAPRINGYVAKVLATDNQHVRTGDILVSIDDADFKAALDQAKAMAAAKAAALQGVEANLGLEAKLIEAKQAALNSALARQALATADLVRAKDLRASGSGSKQNYDAALAASQQADAAVQSAVADLAAERERLTVLESGKVQAQADLDAAKAAIKIAELNLSYTLVRAPFDGVVGAKTVQDGQYVRAGAQMMAVVRLPDVYVVANFKETQAGEMRRGQEVAVEVDAFPDLALKGKIDSFAPATGSEFSLLPPENATGNFTKIVQRLPVKVILEGDANALALLRPGMSVKVSVDTRGEGEGAAATMAPAPRPVEAAGE